MPLEPTFILRCDNRACPIGTVALAPKDHGQGSDEPEIRAWFEDQDQFLPNCPYCDEPMALGRRSQPSTAGGAGRP